MKTKLDFPNNPKNILIFSIIFLSLIGVSYALDDLMGFEANAVDSNGDPIQSANLFIEIWDSSAGGNLVYNSTDDFLGNVSSGKIDVMMGSGAQVLNLEFGRDYYMEIYINNEDLDFDSNERQRFQSTIGNITSSRISPGNITSDLLNGSLAITEYLSVNGTLDIGDASTDLVNFISSIGSNIIPTDSLRDLGTAANRWSTIYADNIVSNNLTGSSVNDTGTASDFFTFNADNPTNDTENIQLIFELGSVGTNAIILWDSVNKRFDLNQDVIIAQNLTVSNNLTVSDSILTDYIYPDSSNNIVFPNGLIGIGTSSPTQNLTVIGDINVTGTSYLSNFIVEAGDLIIGTTNISSTDVGIGTLSPTSKLEVVSGDINFSNGTTQQFFLQSATGNIGIGTSSPTALLDVYGTSVLDVNLSSNLYVNSSSVGIGTSLPNRTLTVSGDTEITGA
ncbi:hypothetical protein HYX17_01170, partial [Candidatus Woesearchaeota archaeon]|nr:hypothetical protein [Candidatus Woesearchaeota archaeon]